MSWLGQLNLDYRRDGERTIALDRHTGPLRVLQRLYPEGPGVCHHVLVHPPGGIVGGDVLQVDAHLACGSHALITTPGATRFYRSAGEEAQQTLHTRVDDDSRLDWIVGAYYQKSRVHQFNRFWGESTVLPTLSGESHWDDKGHNEDMAVFAQLG